MRRDRVGRPSLSAVVASPTSAAGRVHILLAIALGSLAVGALTVWAFLAYTHPDRVLDFAALLQMCGIPVGR